MQNRDDLIATVAAFLKDRDEAFIVSEEQTDDERRDSAAALVAMLEPDMLVWELHHSGPHESAMHPVAGLYLARQDGWRHIDGEWHNASCIEDAKAGAEADLKIRLRAAPIDALVQSLAHETANNAAKDDEIRKLKKLISSTHKNAIKHTDCEIDHCLICDGGLFVCADCGAAEIETEQRVCSGEALRAEKAEADNVAKHNSIVELEAERSGLEGDIANLENQIAELEADNVALTARVKELEGEVFHDPELGITWKQICEQFDKECAHHQQRAEALETQLAVANKDANHA